MPRCEPAEDRAEAGVQLGANQLPKPRRGWILRGGDRDAVHRGPQPPQRLHRVRAILTTAAEVFGCAGTGTGTKRGL